MTVPLLLPLSSSSPAGTFLNCACELVDFGSQRPNFLSCLRQLRQKRRFEFDVCARHGFAPVTISDVRFSRVQGYLTVTALRIAAVTARRVTAL